MEDSDNVIPFPKSVAVQDAADQRMYDRHRVLPALGVLEAVEEMVADEGAKGLVVIHICDGGVMHIHSTHDRLFTEFVLRSASTQMQL